MTRIALLAALALVTPAAQAGAPARLAEMERVAGPLPIPPGATYHDACSQRMGPLTAVFTFGLDANPDGLAAFEKIVAAQDMMFDEAALYAKLESGPQGEVHRAMERFLRTRGLKASSHALPMSVYIQPARDGHGPLEIAIGALNPYALHGGVCGDLMPLGPVYFLSAR